MPIAFALDLRAIFFEHIRLGDDLELGARKSEAF